MRTILLVDDEPNLRHLVRTTLDESDYRILEAADGAAALEVTKIERPELILLDWMMPEVSGIDVLKELRANPATASLPVVMLTAKGQEADRQQALALGVQAFLIKPFSPLELLSRVEELLT